MILTSLASYFVNDVVSKSALAARDFNFEHPLTNLVDHLDRFDRCDLRRQLSPAGGTPPVGDSMALWLALSIIISCGDHRRCADS